MYKIKFDNGDGTEIGLTHFTMTLAIKTGFAVIKRNEAHDGEQIEVPLHRICWIKQ